MIFGYNYFQIDAGRPPDEVYSDFKSSVDQIVSKSGKDFDNIVGSLSSDEDSDDIITNDNVGANGDQTTADKYRRLDSARSYREYKVMEEAVIEEARQHNDIDEDSQNIDIAATKIQAAYRGHRVRAKMKEDSKQPINNNGKEIEVSNEEADAAAVKIQAAYRGHAARKNGKNEPNPDYATDTLTFIDNEETQKAATKIQAAYRGHLVRSKNKSNLESSSKISNVDNLVNDEHEQEEAENLAATKIQAAFRGHKVRSKNQSNDEPNNTTDTEQKDDYDEESQNVTNSTSIEESNHFSE